jgi:nucleoside-diphosphate-sugar epimerase
MDVLVTGATGFLGTHLTMRLLTEGARVRVLARSPARAKDLVAAGAEVVPGEITDASAVRTALNGVGAVYHLAGKLYIPGTPDSVYEHIHVEGTRTLLACAREQPVAPRLVHCSTTGVLGVTGDTPAREDAPYRPTNAYERTKCTAEQLVRDVQRDGMPAVIVRPGLVYGLGDLHLLGFFRSIQSRLFHPIGRRPVWLHPVYITDMTEAFVRCGQDERAIGECFHIAGNEPVTIATLAKTIASALRVPAPRGTIPITAARTVAALGDLLPAHMREHAPLTSSRLDFLTHSRVYDVAKARAILGFSARTHLSDGIALTASWYRSQGLLPSRPETHDR